MEYLCAADGVRRSSSHPDLTASSSLSHIASSQSLQAMDGETVSRSLLVKNLDQSISDEQLQAVFEVQPSIFRPLLTLNLLQLLLRLAVMTAVAIKLSLSAPSGSEGVPLSFDPVV